MANKWNYYTSCKEKGNKNQRYRQEIRFNPFSVKITTTVQNNILDRIKKEVMTYDVRT